MFQIQLHQAVVHEGAGVVDGLLGGNLAVVATDVPQIHQGADGGVKGTASFFCNVQCLLQHQQHLLRYCHRRNARRLVHLGDGAGGNPHAEHLFYLLEPLKQCGVQVDGAIIKQIDGANGAQMKLCLGRQGFLLAAPQQ